MNDLIKALEVDIKGIKETTPRGALDIIGKKGLVDGLLRAIAVIKEHTEGKVLVPVEPTEDMIANARGSIFDGYPEDVYKAMLEKV